MILTQNNVKLIVWKITQNLNLKRWNYHSNVDFTKLRNLSNLAEFEFVCKNWIVCETETRELSLNRNWQSLRIWKSVQNQNRNLLKCWKKKIPNWKLKKRKTNANNGYNLMLTKSLLTKGLWNLRCLSFI